MYLWHLRLLGVTGLERGSRVSQSRTLSTGRRRSLERQPRLGAPTASLKGRWSEGAWEGEEEAGRVSPKRRILWARDENFSKEESMTKGTKR